MPVQLLCLQVDRMKKKYVEQIENLPSDLAGAIEAELSPDEIVIWFGQPLARRMMREGWLFVAVGVILTGFEIVKRLFASPVDRDFRGFDYLFYLFFILFIIPLYSHPHRLRRKARHTAYLVTNRRAIVFDANYNRGGHTISSFPPDRLRDVLRKQDPGGTSDLIFERRSVKGPDGVESTDVGFIAIQDVDEVERLIKQLSEPPDGSEPGNGQPQQTQS
jgi:hypothetical protein